MENLFKKALDKPSVPVSSRVWSSVQAQLPKPWYVQAWVGWIFALLSSLGLLGLGYKVWTLEKRLVPIVSAETFSRIDTVYVSRVDTVYVLYQQSPERSIPYTSMMNPIRSRSHIATSNPTQIQSRLSIDPASPKENAALNSSTNDIDAPKRYIQDSSPTPTIVQQVESSPVPVTSSPVQVPENSPTSAPTPMVADVPSNPAKDKRPFTSDIRLLLSPAASTKGSWSARAALEWEIHQRWALGAGLQGDFFPEVEYNRVADFVRAYGVRPSQMYSELAEVPSTLQDRIEDIEIQRTVFSLPIYGRYYLPLTRGWRWYPEIGYRLSLRTRERVDVDIDTEDGSDFRLFTAENPSKHFSKPFIGAGMDWQSRGWTVQLGSRWVNQEGLSFQISAGRTLLGKKQTSLWRF